MIGWVRMTDTSLVVSAFGFDQTYNIDSPIIILGGDGDDFFDLSGITNQDVALASATGGRARLLRKSEFLYPRRKYFPVFW